MGRLRAEHPFYLWFPDWLEVIRHFNTLPFRGPEKDTVLRPIFLAHRSDRDPRWHQALLLMFWPALEHVFFQNLTRDQNPDDLWTNVYWAFFQVIDGFDLTQRPDCIAPGIVNRVFHRLRDEYGQRWDREKVELQRNFSEPASRPTDGDDTERSNLLLGVTQDSGFHEADDRIDQASSLRRLRKHLAAGRISEPEFFLAVGCWVYGQPVRDCATQVGLPHETAKKRLQRLATRLRWPLTKK